ncbi:kinase-like domain-containing protein [Lasiosphaeris hirsuta]|uniref:Kinase-like domain-containing protein n=1 Tax=Lasiosphaeris hirsuta TaxID=260670 RepID=A0AA40DQ13_9PEZI|nr:kinase-like domain-containing protein [Lasiosphaeris hirsuta]
MLASNPDVSPLLLEELLRATRPSTPPNSSFRKIFAILVLLNKPEAITNFLSSEVYDGSLPLSLDDIKKTWRGGAPEDFERVQWQLLAPFFATSASGSSHHYQLDDGDILPFVRDHDASATPTVSGGFGVVQRVKIHEAHRDFSGTQPEFAPSRTFALKRIPAGSEYERAAFAHEFSALKQFSGQTDHITTLLASFKHRDSQYLLFNWADGGNLRDMWKSNPGPSNLLTAKWMANQFHGLARALNIMHSRSVDKTNITGWRHGDLKPENILCFRPPSDDSTGSGLPTLTIADFGLSRIQTREPTRLRRLAFTATYRPPECHFVDEPISVNYDIWAFGCVLLEFATWYLMGSDGVMNDFPRSRSQIFPLRDGYESFEDDSFFVIDKKRLKPLLKHSVREHIRKLRQHQGCSPYIVDLLDLIEHGMLITAPENRFSSRTCLESLAEMRQNVDSDRVYCDPLRISPETPPPSWLSYRTRRQTDKVPKALQTDSDSSTGRLGYILDGRHELHKANLSLGRLRMWVDRKSGADIDWWPLPPLVRRLPPGARRLTWTYGGRIMSIVLHADAVRRWRKGLVGASNTILPSWRAPLSGTSAGTASTSATSATGRSKASCISRWLSRTATAWSKPAAGLGGGTATSHSPTPSVPGYWKESYICVDRCWTSATETKVSTIVSIDSMADDYALFTEARRVLSCARGNRLQRLFSWRCYTRVRLSQFHFLFNNSDRVKAFDYCALKTCPTDLCCKGYEYTSQHPEVDIHMQIIAEIILQGIRRPELGHGQRTAVDGVPKLKAPPGIRKQALISGWGFHACQGPSLAKMCSWFMVVVALGLAFVPFWLSSINKIDLQNAFAPVSFLITFVGVLFAMGCLVQEGGA